MSPRFGDLIEGVLSGQKTIESRWSKNKVSPFGKVKSGDTVYFKDVGKLVTAKATVSKVLEHKDLTNKTVKEILTIYGAKDGLGIDKLDEVYNWAKDKRYCTLIFLTNPEAIKPFQINKKGFGTPLAWIAINRIEDIKLHRHATH